MSGRLADERYVSLATFRRDGREVRTPVWIAGGNGRLYVYTNARSGKVKRVRATKRVRLAACDLRGKVRGDWTDGTSRMLDDPREREQGFAPLLRKYGWQLRLGLLLSRLSGRYADRAVIEIRPS